MATTPRRVIYSCVTNGYDRLIPPVDPVPGVDYILFTDRPDADRVEGWTTRPLAAPDGLSSSLIARFHKAQPHKVVPDYDEALWADSNVAMISGLSPFLDDVFSSPEPLATFAHPERETVMAEAQAVLQAGRAKALDKIEGEMAAYQADGFPDDGGLFHTAVLARRHMEPKVIETMDLWWQHMSQGSGRDQLSLPFVCWKTGLPTRALTPDFTLCSPYFLRYPHWATSGKRGRALVLAAQRKQKSFFWRTLHDLIVRSYGSKTPHF